MKVSIDNNGNHAALRLDGHFNMEAHAPFRHAYRQVLDDNTVRALTLDLSGVEYIDSSGLGMLLLLQEETETRGIAIVLSGCQPFVLRVLTTANLHNLFKIL